MNTLVRRTVSVFALAGLLLACGCSSDGGRMRQRLRSLAGSGAIDCGNSLFPNLIPKNNACAIGATVEHAPFYIRWEIHDRTPSVMRGIAMNHVGQMFIVTETVGTPDTELPVTPCDFPNLVPDKSITSINTLMCAPRPPGVDQP